MITTWWYFIINKIKKIVTSSYFNLIATIMGFHYIYIKTLFCFTFINQLNFLYTSLLFLSFFYGLYLVFSGYSIGLKGAFYLTFFFGFFNFTNFFILLYFFSQADGNFIITNNYGLWFKLGFIEFDWVFQLDSLAIIMSSLVITVSFVTQVYSYYYLSNEPNLIRFQAYLNFFTFFMLMLVNAGNISVFFLGWEGVGLCSYLLISFWSTRLEARYASLKAVAINRIGDCAFLAGTGIILSITSSGDFAIIFSMVEIFSNVFFNFFGFSITYFELANSFFLIAISAKSAQLGLHTWLADAMEGPTPVSALIHAATMVTAGIFFVIRFSPVFEFTPMVNIAMAFIGAWTAFFGAITASFQWDIKKIIAYSTCSQLGYMLCVCGLSGYTLAFYHLITHGFFKALLFLASGILIHNLNGEQDIRVMGNLKPWLPLTFSYFFIGFTALIGLPGTSGFYSKERILDYVSIIDTSIAKLSYNLLFFALIFTSYYSIRTIFYVFFTKEFRGSKPFFIKVSSISSELPVYTIFVMSILVFFTLFAETFYYPFILAFDSSFLSSSIFSLSLNYEQMFSFFLASKNRYLPFVAIFIGLWLFSIIYIFEKKTNFWRNFIIENNWIQDFKTQIFNFFHTGFYFDQGANEIFFFFFKNFSQSCFLFDKVVCEWVGPFGITKYIIVLNKFFNQITQTKSVFSTISFSFNFITIFLFFFFIILN